MWEWIDDRWHLHGKPVHAGDTIEICWPDRTWEIARVESAERGQRLFAYFIHHGATLAVRIDPGVNNPPPDWKHYDVRWPR